MLSGMGKLRAHHYATRDAVVDHYMELHPEDFERARDCKHTIPPVTFMLIPSLRLRTPLLRGVHAVEAGSNPLL